LQKDVAKQMGVWAAGYWKWEAGKVGLRARYVPRVIAFLGYDPRPRPKSENFGEKLRFARRTLGLTQEELAKRLGLNTKTVARAEREGLPRVRETARVVSEFLGTNSPDCPGKGRQKFERPDLCRASNE